jgi:hypothetical protein
VDATYRGGQPDVQENKSEQGSGPGGVRMVLFH